MELFCMLYRHEYYIVVLINYIQPNRKTNIIDLLLSANCTNVLLKYVRINKILMYPRFLV